MRLLHSDLEVRYFDQTQKLQLMQEEMASLRANSEEELHTLMKEL